MCYSEVALTRAFTPRARLRPRCAVQMETSHTIVLIQYNLQSSSRTYLDYEGLPRALDGDAHSLLLQPETRI